MANALPISLSALENQEALNQESYSDNSPYIDPTTLRMIGEITGLEACKQSLEYMVECAPGSSDGNLTTWGLYVDDLVGMPQDYIIAELLNRLKEAIQIDNRFTGIELNSEKNFELIDSDSIIIYFDVSTIYGNFNTSMEVTQ
nr:MAG TPA: Tail lysozyme [Caudoviricetes sp.]